MVSSSGCNGPGWQTYVLGAFVLVSSTSLGAQQSGVPESALLAVAESRALPEPAASVLRQRPVQLNRDLLTRARISAGDPDALPRVLRLNLFADVVVDAVVERTGPTPAGYWLTGTIAGWSLGWFSLVVNGDVVVGTVRAATGTYALRTTGDGVHVIRERAPTALADRVHGDVAPVGRRVAADRVRPIGRPSTVRRADRDVSPPEDGSRITLLVVYTREARDAEGGHDQINALVDLWVAETNQAYENSGVVHRLTLVETAETDYRFQDPHTGCAECWLRDPSDGRMDEVHALRDETNADLVTLIAAQPYPSGGEARTMVEPTANDAADQYAFSLVRHDSNPLILAHELGHSMGVQHDRYQDIHNCCTTNCPTSPPYQNRCQPLNKPFPYAHGYVNQRAFDTGAPISSRWWTIMAYRTQCKDAGWDDCGPKLMRFSNPGMTYNGDPMGVPGDAPSSAVDGPADARRTLNETRHVVANFRVTPCLQDGMRIRLQAASGSYVIASGNGGGAVLAVGSRLGAWSQFTLVDSNGGCLRAGDTVSLYTSDKFYLRAVDGGGSTLDATDPQATPWAQFVVGRDGNGVLRSFDTVTLQAPSGHYVCAEDGGGGEVRADCATPGTWGRFTITTPDTVSSEPNYLTGGQRLSTGQGIRADRAACRLVFQTDGNLVAYDDGVAYWSARTGGLAAGGSARMQRDGNFVVYDAAGVARWSSRTGGNAGAFLVIENDCSVVLFNAGGTSLWSAGAP